MDFTKFTKCFLSPKELQGRCALLWRMATWRPLHVPKSLRQDLQGWRQVEPGPTRRNAPAQPADAASREQNSLLSFGG